MQVKGNKPIFTLLYISADSYIGVTFINKLFVEWVIFFFQISSLQ